MADDPNVLRDNPKMAWRGIASLLLFGVWAAFIMAYAFLWAQGHTLFQELTILLGSLVVTVMVVGVMWMVYGMRHGFPAS
jgi:hypothetical protein